MAERDRLRDNLVKLLAEVDPGVDPERLPLPHRGPGGHRPPRDVLSAADPMQCDAYARRTGTRCRSWAMKGQTKCRMHGGSSPQARKAGLRRYNMARMASTLRREGRIAVNEHPMEGLLGDIAEAAMWKHALGSLIDGLDTDPREGEAIYGPDRHGEGRAHVLVQMHSEWVERHARFCKMALDAGIEQRRVELAEDQARLIAGVLAAVIDDRDAGLTPPQRLRMRQLAARHLRSVGAG